MVVNAELASERGDTMFLILVLIFSFAFFHICTVLNVKEEASLTFESVHSFIEYS